MADVKQEIKQEIKAESPSSRMDIDAEPDHFEDDLDTYVPPKDDPGQAWLVRIPVDMWQAWSKMYQNASENEEIQIGTLRVFANDRIQMSLDPAIPQHKSISKEYNLEVKAGSYKNTVAFSEKDRPNHRGGQPVNKHLSGAKSYGIQSKSNRYGQKRGAGAGNYRSSIPKQTALAPQIAVEATAVAVNSMDDFAKAYAAAMKPKSGTVYHAGLLREMHPGNNQNLAFSMTSKPKKGAAKAKKEANKDKRVRIEKGELLDAISKCFREYKYWSLKALRIRLDQPESWIKEALDEIAVLIRSGDFALNYKLKPEFEVSSDTSSAAGVKDEVAPQMKSEDESDQDTGDEGGSSDDAMDFEDVKMGESGS